jgi:integrase
VGGKLGWVSRDKDKGRTIVIKKTAAPDTTALHEGRTTEKTEKKAITGRVLFGEIFPPKQKRSGAVARPPAGKGVSTDLQAKNAGPGVHKIAGATGLNLKVGDNDSGSYVWRYRFAGKRREIGLGSRKDVSLAEARAAAADQAALRRKNIDPIDAKRRERAEAVAKARAAKPVTFREMTERFVDDNAGSWRHKYARTCWLSPMVAYAFPKIGQMGVDEISIAHVTAVIKACEAAGVPKTGQRVRSKIEQVLNAAIGSGHRSSDKLNPADGKLHPKRKIKRVPFRAVDLEDAPAVYRELKARIGSHTACAAWCFMILCASRPSEALNAQWAEIDRDKRLWKVPAERMKADHEHVVPLSDEALEVLDHQERVRTGDSIFPGRGGSPISYASFFEIPAKMGVAAQTPHGWRSCFRDYCGDVAEDEPRDLAEAALAHSLGSVEASYRRRTAVEKRRKLMADYSQWLNSDGGKVIALSDHRASHTRKKA